MTCLIELEAT